MALPSYEELVGEEALPSYEELTTPTTTSKPATIRSEGQGPEPRETFTEKMKALFTPTPTPGGGEPLPEVPGEENVVDPEWLKKPARAVGQYVSEMIPRTPEAWTRAAGIPTDWSDPRQVAGLAFPMVRGMGGIDLPEHVQQRAEAVQAAEQTPPWSQERWTAGVAPVLDIAQIAAGAPLESVPRIGAGRVAKPLPEAMLAREKAALRAAVKGPETAQLEETLSGGVAQRSASSPQVAGAGMPFESVVPAVSEAPSAQTPLNVFYDDAVKAYTATTFDPKFGNMHGTGPTPEAATISLNQRLEAAQKYGTWRSVEHPSAVTLPEKPTTTEEISYAPKIEEPRPLPEHEVRTRVGEETPLRGKPEGVAPEEALPGRRGAPEAAEEVAFAKTILERNPVPQDYVAEYSGQQPFRKKASHGISQEAWREAWNQAEHVWITGKKIKEGHGDASTYETIFRGKPTDYAKGAPEAQAAVAPPAVEPALPPRPPEVPPIPLEERGYAGLEPPTTPPVSEPVPGVPQKPSKIGKSIEAKAVEAKLTQGFAETAGYRPIVIAQQSQMATDLIRTSPMQARAMIRGEAPLPEGLYDTALITAMEEHLLKNPNAQVAYEMANSPLVSATSAAAQEMRLMSERVPDSITAKFAEIKAARAEGAKLRGETAAKVAKEINKEVVRTASKRPTWEAFVREIVC